MVYKQFTSQVHFLIKQLPNYIITNSWKCPRYFVTYSWFFKVLFVVSALYFLTCHNSFSPLALWNLHNNKNFIRLVLVWSSTANWNPHREQSTDFSSKQQKAVIIFWITGTIKGHSTQAAAECHLKSNHKRALSWLISELCHYGNQQGISICGSMNFRIP